MSEEKFEVVIFKGKTFGKLLEEIHVNSRKSDELILGLVEDLKTYIENLGDAIRLAPIIAQYVKMAIDNNEHLIKMAAIVQKSLEKAKAAGDDSLAIFSEDEKRELEQLALEYSETLKLPAAENVVGELTSKVASKSKAAKPKIKKS